MKNNTYRILLTLLLSFNLNQLNANAEEEQVSIPLRKPGLWLTTVDVPIIGMKHIVKECVDVATDTTLMNRTFVDRGEPGVTCTSTYSREGGSYIVLSKCSKEGMEMNSKTTLSGDFQSGYSGQSLITFSTGQSGYKLPNQHLQLNSIWEGECPPDMKPGDVELDDGTRSSVR